MSRLTLGRPLGQHTRRRLVNDDPSAPPVAVYADAAGNRVDPRQHWLARPVSVPCPVNSQPSILQQVLCLCRRRRLAPEESQQDGAQRGDQDGRRLSIGLLVTLHPAIQFRTSPSALTVLSPARLHLDTFATTEREVTLVVRILKKNRNLINPRYRQIRCPGQKSDISIGSAAPANHITKRTCSCDIPPIRGNKQHLGRPKAKGFNAERVNPGRRLISPHPVDGNNLVKRRFEGIVPYGGFQHFGRSVREDRQRNSLQ